MKVAIAGATGFVGSRLVERLHSEGHSVMVLARDSERARRIFPASAYPNLEIVGYSPAESGDWQHSIGGCDGVVNLAGVPIAEERWTAARQQAILDSRKLTTAKLVEAIANANPKPSVFVSASAIGYYGTSETAEFEENSPGGDDFLAEVCKEWESAAEKVKNTGTRLVILRLGIVLGMGGALAKMLPAFRLFAGGPIGTGKQWFSWIHRDDVVNLILYALQNPQVEGVLNATAPHPVRMNELCETLGEVLQRPSWLPVPSFALELLLGDGAKVVLEGQQVLPKRTLVSGFQYEYPKLRSALEEIVKHF
ncbi:MAG: TIGR01777 family protein [Oscillatoriales cyanobacterium]|uniref:TIGR01777 family oxidoreductase n=1 Tax=Microcoleus anatoxicus PTRS2 TaxID=2705321 RepID=A0ABU8YUA0_9CYAN|nr:MAG: TIGR01777 family protein [Oscillatoriales cyanobacterium]TAD95449.1 MAG: TIGR01777 family protein [Oscillatoriales cyanobacterium]TAE02026.1 MAG: TIGR01777 family protein [Oscillatoriales cyanobacterium]TAE98682.1 MAG: TIGR01777 family protein [Oscillatoriales cyanobacterium]TAF36921.1 MAG: TIGR01777 family protein [Oscillatoriales cyanobacterium]